MARFTIKENTKYYVLPLNNSSYGIFINNMRVISSADNEVQLGDIVTLERPQDNSCKWYVNNQYVGTGNIVSFTLDDYLYSAANNKFYISWQ